MILFLEHSQTYIVQQAAPETLQGEGAGRGAGDTFQQINGFRTSVPRLESFVRSPPHQLCKKVLTVPGSLNFSKKAERGVKIYNFFGCLSVEFFTG